ncbi:MAG: hypothetical protein K2K95_07840 [Muribaculaceae bacterium]|nr:hypothetical protein [Muribaculaceae bacterium]
MEFKSFSLKHRDHQVPRGLLREALLRIKSDAKEGQHVVDFGRVIGFSELVPVTEDEEFYEMVRDDRPYPSRFVKNRLPIEVTKLMVVWRRVNEEHICVTTAYFTDNDHTDCPDEPANILRKMNKGMRFTDEYLQRAYDFWSKHAFVEQIPLHFLR